MATPPVPTPAQSAASPPLPSPRALRLVPLLGLCLGGAALLAVLGYGLLAESSLTRELRDGLLAQRRLVAQTDTQLNELRRAHAEHQRELAELDTALTAESASQAALEHAHRTLVAAASAAAIAAAAQRQALNDRIARDRAGAEQITGTQQQRSAQDQARAALAQRARFATATVVGGRGQIGTACSLRLPTTDTCVLALDGDLFANDELLRCRFVATNYPRVEVAARVAARDAATGLVFAVLSPHPIDAPSLHFIPQHLTLAGNAAPLATPIIAYAAAVLGQRVLEDAISDGTVGSVAADGHSMLLTLPANPGSAGAPVLDASGNAVGVLIGNDASSTGMARAITGPAVAAALLRCTATLIRASPP